VRSIKQGRSAVNSRLLASRIRPVGVYCYIDNVQVWLREPLGPRQRRWLQNRCDCFVDDQPARFDPRYVQRLQIRQPPETVRKWITQRRDAYVNRLELALDLVFASEREKEEAETFIRKHLVKNHRGKQDIRLQGGTTTMYLAAPEAANNIVTYGDQECRITGEINCLHIEWRKRGGAAVRQEGITTKNLNDIDHRDFWQRKLLLDNINARKLGREYRKIYEGRRHRRRDQVYSWAMIDHIKTRRLNDFHQIRQATDHLLPRPFRSRNPTGVSSQGSSGDRCLHDFLPHVPLVRCLADFGRGRPAPPASHRHVADLGRCPTCIRKVGQH
jgi:hypothetical protein